MNHAKLEEAIESVRKAFSANDKKIGILYSGGKDSTAVLLTIAKEFPDAELYLYALNNGCMYPEEIRNKVKEKLELFASKGLVKNKMTAIYFDFREMMAFLGFRSFHDDMHTYPTGLLCCTCKVIMHFLTAKYSSTVGVVKIADGYSYFERFLPEQLPEFKKVVAGPIADKYGIEIVSPLYHVFDAADAPMNIIKGFGLDPGIFLGEKQGQGVCMLGLIYKIPYDVNEADESQNVFFNAMRDAVLDYTGAKLRLISGAEAHRLARRDSYGHEYMADISYDELMDKAIAAKEVFFES
ncbi:hypothetical protein [Anaeroselena agilis]|uniref:Uncharacterized protein n=1 Tax=Anaeroselena agilis TaxID=3063788 RepID=A0ABU3NSG0_9FIRM|nr:hypothetical protein [Selenomonadales bacterium 4137-cl]